MSMRDATKKFGINAGKIWNNLNNYGPMNQTLLIKKTRLTNPDFHAAIGWLARENKICKDKEFYRLGDTNLTSRIGENAGKIWHILNSHGEVDISTIAKISNMGLYDAYSAIGWLARENKIEEKKSNIKSNNLKFKLK